MKDNLLKALCRLKNTGTIVAIVSAVILVLNNVGIIIDSEKAMYTVNTLCGVGVTLGVLNNPTTKGMDFPRKGTKVKDSPIKTSILP